MENGVLLRDGLSIEFLEKISYRTKLNLKKSLNHYSEKELMDDFRKMTVWYESFVELHNLALDYRIKSMHSMKRKYQKNLTTHRPLSKVFNDTLGLRSICPNYGEILGLDMYSHVRVVDMSSGKSLDDGYRGIHVYFQLDNHHYPIEIQYNTLTDRQFNNWLHIHLYKKEYDNIIGASLRSQYESGKIKSEKEFLEVLDYVLSGSKRF